MAAFQGPKLWFLVPGTTEVVSVWKGLEIWANNSGRRASLLERGDRVQNWVLSPPACILSLLCFSCYGSLVSLHLFVVQVSPVHWPLTGYCLRHLQSGIGWKEFSLPQILTQVAENTTLWREFIWKTCFQALCTDSKISVWLCFCFCYLSGMSLLLLSRQHLCIAFPFSHLDFINIFVIFWLLSRRQDQCGKQKCSRA